MEKRGSDWQLLVLKRKEIDFFHDGVRLRKMVAVSNDRGRMLNNCTSTYYLPTLQHQQALNFTHLPHLPSLLKDES